MSSAELMIEKKKVWNAKRRETKAISHPLMPSSRASQRREVEIW